jgi:hypothetical protein
MYKGMTAGWFRKSREGKAQTLARYFSQTVDDPYGAREIINGDKRTIPKWAGVSIGKLIAGYHTDFLAALQASAELAEPVPPPALVDNVGAVHINIQSSPGVSVSVAHNGVILVG